MPAHFTILTTSTQPADRREVARKVAGMTLLVSLLGVVVITVLTLLVLRRMRRRLTDSGRARRTRHSDAWAEAGRRAGSPPAEALEAHTPVLPEPDPGPPTDKPGGPYG